MERVIRQSWVPAALFFVALLPFVHRAWLFDDPSMIVAARAAVEHPLRPYDFTIDAQRPGQTNWPPNGRLATTNPPLSAWLLAGVLRAAGEREVPLHLAMFMVAACHGCGLHAAALWPDCAGLRRGT
jgi:hypothetical protein